jgi:hypothetical protein
MPGKRKGRASQRVFLNVPYSSSYERLLVALTAALVALGRVPQLTFQIPDGGQGRMKRIFDLLSSCEVSIHDLSCVGLPARLNMPFELGLAWAVREQDGNHEFMILERVPHRLDKTLSDLKAVDPKIHHGRARGAICAILESLEKPGGNPSAAQVMRLHRRLMTYLPALKAEHGGRPLFTTRVYGKLVAMGLETAKEMFGE